ncbi:MAG TPA: hypothetical protein VN651_16700 [Gemmatimonadaceae bacterium]|nr:hypothetical protein [Gemmatimonadaceae bacterium]
MPKLIVLFYGAESPASSLAEAAAHGAGHVRFTEVELLAGGAHEAGTGKGYPRLSSAASLADYAGILIACPAAGEIPGDLDRLLTELARSPDRTFLNTVFGVSGGDNTVLLGRVARLGGIIVAEPRGAIDPEARARVLGERVAKVVSWVRHSLGHEGHDGDAHGHGHGHSH